MAYFTFDDVVLIKDTGKAWLIRQVYDDETDIPEEFTDEVDQWWVPISVIEDTDMEVAGDQGFIEVPVWFAKKSSMPGAED